MGMGTSLEWALVLGRRGFTSGPHGRRIIGKPTIMEEPIDGLHEKQGHGD